ncbi:hypothetical protein HLPR_04920 [Helicovermis profundi]|uniref:Uncharacterized protein n=1 Tax=Helicovermis profundi TaxID=3065157 RepID=A0AAU9ELM1_9FIRM|nr:hypothetical protein HLPR_04920 [Clostridia bacterium S502]
MVKYVNNYRNDYRHGLYTFSFRWLKNCNEINKAFSLRIGELATIFHFFRVLIYILGRIGPLKEFDKNPKYRQSGDVNLFWVNFAGTLSVTGLIGFY